MVRLLAFAVALLFGVGGANADDVVAQPSVAGTIDDVVADVVATVDDDVVPPSLDDIILADKPGCLVYRDGHCMTPQSIAIGCAWFIVIALMFFAQHHVCDAYFIPAINVFTDTMSKSSRKGLQRWGEPAVAGATICALGCNGPELFCNLIALYTHNDSGIGVVVGSEIFNLLIIIGAATLAAPGINKSPLELEKVPFIRDCLAYLCSILLLYFFIDDKIITKIEAFILLGAAAMYVSTVYFTQDIAKCLGVAKAEASDNVEIDESQETYIHGVKVEVHEVLHGRYKDMGSSVRVSMNEDGGQVLDIEEEARINASNKKKGQRQTVGIQLGGHAKGKEAPLLSAGGLLLYSHMSEVKIMGEGILRLEFLKGLYHTTLEVKCENSAARELLVKRIEEEDNKTWVHTYDPTIRGAWIRFLHELGHGGIGTKLFAFPEFLIDGALRLTLFPVDVKQVQKEGRWPLCFCGAMAWLAVFSFLMLEVATAINANIPVLPMPFLGITVCAVGTSFPNAIASIIMSSQNKPAAAIANALGSNVQNVFLAMALPWVIFILSKQGSGDKFINDAGDLVCKVTGINEGVMWMLVTLIILLVMVFPIGCTIRKWMGYFLCVLYVAWLILTSVESFGVIPALVP